MSTAPDKIRPLHNNILVRVDPPRSQVGHIFVPERSQGEVGTGVVVAVGPGWVDPETGRRHVLDIAIGDRVAYEVLRSIEKVIETEGDEQTVYTVIQERHVIGVLEGEGEIEVRA